MATPIRKKRNFKALQLSTAPAPPTSQNIADTAAHDQPIPTRQAPPASGKKRPPPMTLKAPKLPPSTTSATIEDGNLLTVQSSSNSAPNTAASPSAKRVKYDLRNEELKDLHELGQGNGGSVKKVEHTPTGTIMAKKIVLIDAKPSVRKQILRELQIMHNCSSRYIVSFYGAYLADPNICICMEFMDRGSLDGIYKKIGAIDIDIVGQVALAVLEGLTYLYDVHRIIHRGEIKICDFGVSGELINSIADTFVGTSTYMSPERIQGAQYTVKSDVWSLGISLIELALGRFPFAESESDDSDLSDLEGTLSPARPGSMGSIAALSLVPRQKPPKGATARKDKRKSKGVSLQGGGMTMSILELLQHIVNEPAPKLTPEGRFPDEAENFVNSCLLKDPDSRKTPKELLKYPWIEQAKTSTIDVEAWANTC
ncbi:Pkinase-domain-containing protein [Lentinula aciculospora]|uniref:Pkinase-domain-containing protein n=1 Tax=Lentinula aciculospora TaxID=153920 RepID=A0A9W9DR63_9AGAR|nr:Pkinase-domain-containing protein [Lentinula aciculospora]